MGFWRSLAIRYQAAASTALVAVVLLPGVAICEIQKLHTGSSLNEDPFFWHPYKEDPKTDGCHGKGKVSRVSVSGVRISRFSLESGV